MGTHESTQTIDGTTDHGSRAQGSAAPVNSRAWQGARVRDGQALPNDVMCPGSGGQAPASHRHHTSTSYSATCMPCKFFKQDSIDAVRRTFDSAHLTCAKQGARQASTRGAPAQFLDIYSVHFNLISLRKPITRVSV